MFLWTYTRQLAGDDDGWWKAATQRTAALLEGEHWWIDASRMIPQQTLLVDTTAILLYGLARSHDEDPAMLSGGALMGWAQPRLAPLEELVEHSLSSPPDGDSALQLWRQTYAGRRQAIVQELAYLLVAAGHRLPIAGEPVTEHGPVASLWVDLVRPQKLGHRYATLPSPALTLGLTALTSHFERPARQA